MNEMNQKKLYIWRLASFLHSHGKQMSIHELGDHLNRNSFLTSYGAIYKGERGTAKLIHETYNWVNELGLKDEADSIAQAYVASDGTHAWER